MRRGGGTVQGCWESCERGGGGAGRSGPARTAARPLADADGAGAWALRPVGARHRLASAPPRM